MCAYTGYSDAASLRIDASLVANQTACQSKCTCKSVLQAGTDNFERVNLMCFY
jgi:hypothetical protein